MADWDPTTYRQFADERARPFADLIGRVDATDPAYVVDLGCGPGELTASLAERWPTADVLGVDSSPEMVATASALAGGRLRFRAGDIAGWTPERPVDVLVSNAALQWVPGHVELLPSLVAALAPGGRLAFQVPGNFDQPSHVLLRELAADPRFAAFTDGRIRPSAYDAERYLDELVTLGCRVDGWETTYLHVLSGPDPVFRWISGTGARPVLQALPDDLRARFEVEYRQRLQEAYPERSSRTVLPFRRVFVVAGKES